MTTPGPVSDSMPTPRDVTKRQWLKEMKVKKFKYFILKAEDFLQALDADEIEHFNYFMQQHEKWRVEHGKTPSNDYWVVNRDEPYADQVCALIFPSTGGLE